jgi:transcriptional regulator with PAS, ATPase and Fis domain
MDSPRRFVGTSVAARDVEQEIEIAARSDAKVLITGESGVGKEVVANLIHRESRRRHHPFVPINCAGVPDTLLESELFGHVRGSFTDAYRDKIGWLDQAQTGTIFLDEIGEMSARMQAVLLRFLENGEIQRVGSVKSGVVANVRVIAATNRNLLEQVTAKKFRDDLYYRLNVIHIRIPPLRERPEDVRPLLEYLMQHAAAANRMPVPVVPPEILARLEAYAWPGNVRELRNVAERLVVRRGGNVVPATDLPREIVAACAAPSSQTVTPSDAFRASVDRIYESMTVERQSFWTVVYEPFMARDITRDHLREVVSRGLEHTRGSYKQLLPVFNLPAGDYKRLLSFLRKYRCHVPFQSFRSIRLRPASVQAEEREVERLAEAG